MDLAPLELAPLATARLRLEPVTAEMARAVLAGDLSVLAAAGLTAAEARALDRGAAGMARIDTDGLTVTAAVDAITAVVS